MRRPVILLLVLVIVLGVGVFALVQLGIINLTGQPSGTGGNVPVVQGTPTPTDTPIVLQQLVIAVQELPRGIRIPEEGALAVVHWPIQTVPNNAITDPKEAIGRIVRTDIFVEEPILSDLLAQDLSQIARTGSDAAAMLPANFVAVTIPVDRLSDVGYAVQDGDYVDVIVAFLFVDVDDQFQTILPNKIQLISIKSDGSITVIQGIDGRIEPTNLGLPSITGPTENQRPRLVTQRTIAGALVIHTGTFPPNGKYIGIPATPTPIPVENNSDQNATKGPPPPTPTPPFPDVITLGVPLQDAVALTWFVEAKVPITLALRSTKDNGSVLPSTGVTLRYLIDTYGIAAPPKLPYSLEPALRSIRQVVTGAELQFSTGGSGPAQ